MREEREERWNVKAKQQEIIISSLFPKLLVQLKRAPAGETRRKTLV